jgi:hypothetical protein
MAPAPSGQILNPETPKEKNKGHIGVYTQCAAVCDTHMKPLTKDMVSIGGHPLDLVTTHELWFIYLCGSFWM